MNPILFISLEINLGESISPVEPEKMNESMTLEIRKGKV